jgi:hypothetical protein
MKHSITILLLTVLGMLSIACGPAATATPEPTTGTPIQAADPGPAEPVVIPVNQQIEQEGITVGITEVTLTGQEVTVNYWRDCGPHHLEPTQPAVLVVAGEPVSGSGGGGGNPCDPSHIWHMTFPPLPADVETFSFLHGEIIGSSPEEIVLELSLSDQLSTLDPAFGGELELDLLAESGELAYHFTKLSKGTDRFTLDLQPANEAARSRPLGSPLGELFIEDDQGNQYRGGRSSASFRNTDPMTLVWEDERLEFRGMINTGASTWRLRVPNLGKIYRGPWQFDIDIPPDVDVPTPVPTPSPTPTPSPAPRVITTPTATPEPGDPTRLMQALAMVPLEFSGQQITSADFATSRTVTGLEEMQSIEDFGNLGEDIYRLYEGVPAMPSQLRSYVVSLREQTGLELFLSELGIWGLRSQQGMGSTFLLFQGRHPKDTVTEKLLALDYKPAEHRDTTYYWLNEDYVMDIRHPLRTMTLLLNRVALMDEWLMATPATSIMERLIDARTGEAPALLDSPPHRVLAETIGHGLVGGAFLTPDWILETWNLYGDRPVERLDRYTSGPDPWGRLSPYAVGLMGYRVQGEAEELVIALYYRDPKGASQDSAELEKRWRTFHQDLTTSGPVETLITRHCSPMSTSVIEQADFSVLVGACPVIREEEPGPQAFGPGVWTMLLEFGELPFLALDLEELRAAAEQRRANELVTQEVLKEMDK